jgi:hypothetical protein
MLVTLARAAQIVPQTQRTNETEQRTDSADNPTVTPSFAKEKEAAEDEEEGPIGTHEEYHAY